MPISTIGSNSLNQTSDLTINGVTVGKGGGSVSTNTALGASALAANTTGANNIAVGGPDGAGNSPLKANTTGGQNTAVGNGALGVNTTADYNTAVGYQTLKLNTTGTQNSAYGQGAMENNTTGNYNVSVGKSALASNTTASNNTAVGYQAGYGDTTSGVNTYLGAKAGYTGSTGDGCTFLGYQSGYTTTGTINTFVGYNSGYYISSGTKNTIIGGYNGNQGGLDIRTSSNYIVLSDGDGNPAIYNRPAGASAASGKNTTVFGMVDAPVSGETVTVNCNNNSAASNSYGIIVSGRPTDVTVYAMRFYNANASTIVGSIQINTTTTTYATSSDYRLKENITPMTGALDTVVQLNPVTYKWKQDGSDGQGFIAHELQAVVPDAVVGEKDAVDEEGKPVYQGIDTSFLVATLTAAIKELKALVDAQATEIAELKAKVAP